MKVPFGKPFIVGKELYNIAQAVFNSQLSGDGLFTKKCHQWLEAQLHCNKALLTHSCTAALEMAAILFDIQAGDEVILPSFTFVSTANAFVLRGAVPVFIDIRPDTLNIDERLIEQAITSKTKAIVPVHYAGVGCDMSTIMDIASQHKLWVVEDAAQAIFAKYKNQYLGTIGHLGCLSFHETKNIISGEGGALLINDESLMQRAEVIREKGTNRSQFFRGEIDKYTWVDIGSSYLPSELVAAFLYAQLENTEKINDKRQQLCQLYFQQLLPLQSKGFIKLPELDASLANGHIFYLMTNSLAERTRLIDFLKKQGIHAVFHYVPLHSSPAGLKFGRTASQMSVTDEVSNTIVRLPLYYEMSEEQVGIVVNTVLRFFGIR